MLLVLAPPPSGTASPAAPRTDRPPSLRRSLRFRLIGLGLRGVSGTPRWRRLTNDGALGPSTRRDPIKVHVDHCRAKCKRSVKPPIALPSNQNFTDHPVEPDWSVDA